MSARKKTLCGTQKMICDSINHSDFNENDVVQRFGIMYPAYDYYSESSYSKKNTRKKKHTKSMY